eukprot:4016622-Prymnesium_polylepis.5
MSVPEQLVDLGCDAAFWDVLPKGGVAGARICSAKRFVREGKEEMARNRIATMREIAQLVEDGTEPGNSEAWRQA